MEGACQLVWCIIFVGIVLYVLTWPLWPWDLDP